MPQIVCNQPKTLLDLCVVYAALNVDNILEIEENKLFNSRRSISVKYDQLPDTLFHLVSEKVLEIGVVNDSNFEKIFNHRTRNILLRKNSCRIKNPAHFLEFIRDNCKDVVKIDLQPLLEDWDVKIEIQSSIVGKTLSALVHLEWINLKNAYITDQCLQFISFKCHKLKYLNVGGSPDITSDGISSLCDPVFGRFRITTLTHLHLRCTIDGPRPLWFNLDVVSSFLLHCHNLVELDYEFNAHALSAAIERSALLGWLNFGYTGYSAVNDSCDNRGRHRVFKIKTLEFNAIKYHPPLQAEPFFKLVGKHCPHLEEFALKCPVKHSGDLNGIFHLTLKSITVVGDFSNIDLLPIDFDTILLVRSVSASLTKLNLSYHYLFDLRVISQECPNLTVLSLKVCDTKREGSAWPNYFLRDLSNAKFELLTHLKLDSSSISNENYIALLSSPNLTSLTIGENMITDWLVPKAVTVIPQVLLRNPDAFCALKSVKFKYMEMTKSVLFSLVERAAVLNELVVYHCFKFENGARVPFNEQQHSEQLIKNNNWALTTVWKY